MIRICLLYESREHRPICKYYVWRVLHYFMCAESYLKTLYQISELLQWIEGSKRTWGCIFDNKSVKVFTQNLIVNIPKIEETPKHIRILFTSKLVRLRPCRRFLSPQGHTQSLISLSIPLHRTRKCITS